MFKILSIVIGRGLQNNDINQHSSFQLKTEIVRLQKATGTLRLIAYARCFTTFRQRATLDFKMPFEFGRLNVWVLLGVAFHRLGHLAAEPLSSSPGGRSRRVL